MDIQRYFRGNWRSPEAFLILMAVAMLVIPVVDGLAKYLSTGHSPLYIGWARYASACVIVLPFAMFSHGRRIFPQHNIGLHILRTIFLMSAMKILKKDCESKKKSNKMNMLLRQMVLQPKIHFELVISKLLPKRLKLKNIFSKNVLQKQTSLNFPS
mgnify:CR=1 FL=1